MARTPKTVETPESAVPEVIPVRTDINWDSREAVSISPVEIRAILEDKIVTAVREAGHCREADAVMKKAWPALETLGKSTRARGDWRDASGTNCWGDTWRDDAGFDRLGFDANGRDRDGYNREGFNQQGFNREGLDKEGLAPGDPARFKYNLDGYDAEGYNRQGVNRKGQNREQAALLKLTFYDADGFDPDGYTKWGEPRGGGAYDSGHEYGSARFDVVALVTRWRAEGKLPNDDGSVTAPATPEAPATA